MKLPEFIAKAQIKPGPLIDSSKQFQAIQSVFGRIEKQTAATAQRLAVQESVRRGAVAGEDPAFHPIPDFSPAAQAFNKAALTSNKYMAGAEVIDKINNLQRDAEQNISPTSVVDFKKRAAGFASGLMSTIPAENRPFVKNYIFNRVTNAEHQLQQKLDTRNRALLLDEFERTNKTYVDAMTNAAWNGKEPEAASIRGTILQKNQAALNQGLLSPSQFTTLNELTEKEFNVNRTIGAFRAILHSGILKEPLKDAKRFISEFDNAKNSYAKFFTPEERRPIINQLKQQVKSLEVQDKIDKLSIRNDKKDLLFAARQGASVDPQRLNAIKLGSTPAQFKDFQQDLNNAEFEGSVHSRAVNGTIASNNLLINTLSRPLRTEDLAKPGISKFAQARANAVKDIIDINKQWKTDPAGMAEKTDEYQEALNKANEMPDQTSPLFLTRVRIGRQIAAGVNPRDVKILPLATKTAILNRIESFANFSDQVNELEKIVDGFGEFGSQLVAELSTGKQKLPFQAGMVLAMKENDPSIPLVKTAIRAFESNENDLINAAFGKDRKFAGDELQRLDQAVRKDLALYGDTLRSSTLPSEGISESVIKSVKQIAMAVNWENKGMSIEQASKIASDAAINDLYHLDQSFNSVPYRIPTSTKNNLDKSFVESAVHIVAEDIQKSNLKFPTNYLSNTNIPLETQKDQWLRDMVGAKGMHFVNTKDGLEAVDKAGTPLINADTNEPFTIKWADLLNPDSDLYKRVTAEIERTKGQIIGISSEIPLLKGILSSEAIASNILGDVTKGAAKNIEEAIAPILHESAHKHVKFRSIIKPRNEGDALLLAISERTGIPILSQIPSFKQVRNILEASKLTADKRAKKRKQ